MGRSIAMLAALGFLFTASVSVEPIVVDGELCHPRNLMVKYADPSSLSTIRKLGHVIRFMPQIHYAVVETLPGKLQQTRRQLQSWPGIGEVDLDRCALPAYDPNDFYWPNEWHMKAIRANFAWDTTKGNPNVIVAVIDTGAKVDHPDLAADIWTNASETPGNGIDDDGNGYIDDVNGYDFAYGDSSPDDVQGHGTATAGLVGAVQDNTVGVTGVAPHCKVMVLKASNDSGYFYDSSTVPAYLYAADNEARVLSMSYFSDRVSQSERDAMEYCWSHGVLPVAAAGNSASIFPYYPGGYEHVLSVAAVDGNLNKAGFSNYGSWVDVAAPGTGLYSTTADGGYTSGFGGTSGACPHVAGTAALCFSMNLNASNEEVREAIEDTATLQSQAPYGEFSNYGFINAEAAVLRMAGGGTTSHPPIVRYVTRYVQNGSRTGSRQLGRIYGRGFASPNAVSLNWNGTNVAIAGRSRDWIDFDATNAPAGVNVVVNGNQIASVPFPGTATTSYLMSEASTQGATLAGGFFDTLLQDGNAINCTRRSDGYILVQGTFRKLAAHSNFTITLRRQYIGTTVGTEKVQLYNWASASYPYGSWVTLGSSACPTAMTSATYSISDAGRFIDPEGTVYLLITTSTNLPSGAELNLDYVRLDGG